MVCFMVQKTRRAIYFEGQEKKRGTYVKVEGRAWLTGSSYCAKFFIEVYEDYHDGYAWRQASIQPQPCAVRTSLEVCSWQISWQTGVV